MRAFVGVCAYGARACACVRPRMCLGVRDRVHVRAMPCMCAYACAYASALVWWCVYVFA